MAIPFGVKRRRAHRATVARYAPWLLRDGSGAARPFLPTVHSPTPGLHTSELPRIAPDTAAQPLVSVIIPVYGNLEYTARCLSSIASNPPVNPYEIVIVDDASPDSSLQILQTIPGIRIVAKKTNEGFIRACNDGAAEARGQYLLFLNNDTEVTKGWLDELTNTFTDFPDAGLVGSKLLYPNGLLQEAGAIIWNDGSAWNFGRDCDASDPIYNYARDVDYCSGASIMVPANIFNALGGFDELYCPAYGEDSDIALKIRDRGYRVIYQPFSTVVHHEGITSGTDTTRGIKKYQVENSRKLYRRWRNRLVRYAPPGENVDAVKDRSTTLRVLVLDQCTPTPDQDAGSLTAYNIMRMLREFGFQITFVPVDNFAYIPNYTPALQRIGIETLYGPWCNSVTKHLAEYGGRYDLVLVFRVNTVEQTLSPIQKYCSRAKIVFHTTDLHHLRMYREAKITGSVEIRSAADAVKDSELDAIAAADTTIVHSSYEYEYLHQQNVSGSLHVLPLAIDVPGTDVGYRARSNLLFLGGYNHLPNVDAVRHFASDIMPHVRSTLPKVKFEAIGSNMPNELQALATEDVIMTGYVENLKPIFDRTRVFVAPLRYGAGIKGKIGIALSMGLPTVATPMATEGMGLTDRKNILIADGEVDFARSVAAVYNDKTLWNRLSRNGLCKARSDWSWDAARQILAQILADIDLPFNTESQTLRLNGDGHWRIQPPFTNSRPELSTPVPRGEREVGLPPISVTGPFAPADSCAQEISNEGM